MNNIHTLEKAIPISIPIFPEKTALVGKDNDEPAKKQKTESSLTCYNEHYKAGQGAVDLCKRSEEYTMLYCSAGSCVRQRMNTTQ